MRLRLVAGRLELEFALFYLPPLVAQVEVVLECKFVDFLPIERDICCRRFVNGNYQAPVTARETDQCAKFLFAFVQF